MKILERLKKWQKQRDEESCISIPISDEWINYGMHLSKPKIAGFPRGKISMKTNQQKPVEVHVENDGVTRVFTVKRSPGGAWVPNAEIGRDFTYSVDENPNLD